MSVALLDGDIIAFRAALVGQEENSFLGEGLTLNVQKAYDALNQLIREWTSAADCTSSVMVFSGTDGFRYEVLPSYKHNRKGAEKPALYASVVAAAEKHYTTLRYPRLEADDTMGILGSADPRRWVIVSSDKDMLTLPARVYIPGKTPFARLITPALADYAWMTQTLTGDAVDGYKGCPGVGPVGAEKLLRPLIGKLDRMWRAVVQQFEAKGLTEDDALVQARVARILRHTDFDTKTREVILWHPKVPSRLQTVGSASTIRPVSPSSAAPAAARTGPPMEDAPAAAPTPKPRRQKKVASKAS